MAGRIRVFATDIHQEALKRASAGVYPREALVQHLRRAAGALLHADVRGRGTCRGTAARNGDFRDSGRADRVRSSKPIAKLRSRQAVTCTS